MIRFSKPKSKSGKQLFDPKTGRSLNRGSSGGSRPTPPPAQTNAQRNIIFEKFRSGEITRGQAIGQVQGSSARASFEARLQQAQQQAQILAQQQEQARIKATKLKLTQAEAEKARITKQRDIIIARGAREKIRNSRDIKTDNELKITEWSKGANTVRKVEDLTTGITRYTSFGTGRGGGSVRQTGGVVESGFTAKQIKDKKKFKQFQDALKPIRLPAGFAFVKDKLGNIVNIDDMKRGINIELSQLPNITKAYMFFPILKEIFKPKTFKELIASIPKQQRELTFWEKFSPKKVNNFVYRRRYAFYKNNYGGKLSYNEFIKEQFKAPNKDFQKTAEGQKIVKALGKSINDQIQNPSSYGTTTRLSALLSAGGAAGLPTAGIMLFGAGYYSTLGLAKDVSRTPLPKNFKGIAKVVAVNFGIGAVQGLMYGLAFGAGTKILTKLGRPLINLTFKPALAKTISMSTQLAIQRGFSILGINYVTKLAGQSASNIKNIVVGDKLSGITGLSGSVGALVGFAIPAIAIKVMSRKPKKKVEIEKQIKEIEGFRRGSLNAAYLKAKNAQFKDPSRGVFVSRGSAKKLNKDIITGLYKVARNKGISRAELIEGSYYVQKFKVKSDVPKYEALLKILKARLRGKTIKIKSVSKYFTFERQGIVIAKQGKNGIVKAFAIEFNKVGNKISNVGFKTAVGSDKITAIKIYKKGKFVEGKPLRVKLEDVFLVKNKIETRVPINKNMVKILNTLETRKVFLNNKKISRNQLISLKNAIKADFKTSKNNNIANVLRKIYKDKRYTSKSGVTNTIRIQRIRDRVKIIPSNKKSFINFKINPKGQFVEIGYTKLRIPSIKKLKVTGKAIIKPKVVRRVVKKVVIRKPVKLKNVNKQIRETKILANRNKRIEIKRSMPLKKIKQVERAVKSIQSIIRPATKQLKVNRKLSISVLSNLLKSISLLLPLVSSKNTQLLRSIQENLKTSLSIQRNDAVTATGQKKIQALQSMAITALRRITKTKIIIPKMPRIIGGRPRPPKPVEKKKPPITPQFKLSKGFKRRKLAKAQPTFFVKIKRRGKIVNLNPKPLTQRDAKDFLAYSIDNGLERSAWFEPLGRKKTAVKLPAKMAGYFTKNSKKLRPFKIRVGKKKSIRNGYIEKRKHILDTRREKAQMRVARRKTKRRTPKRKPSTAMQKQRLRNLAKARAKLRRMRQKRR